MSEDEHHMGCPLHWKGLFHSRKISTILLPDFHIMPFGKIRVTKMGFNPYHPEGNSNCNGQIYIVSPRKNDESGTSVLVFPISQISS